MSVVPINGPMMVVDYGLLSIVVTLPLAYGMFIFVVRHQRNRTAVGRLLSAFRFVLFRVSLEGTAWLLGLLLFTVVSFFFFHARDFRFLLPSFLLTMNVLRGYAWWIAGGKGIPALAPYLDTTGLGLRSAPLFLWTTMGIVLSVLLDVFLLMESAAGAKLLRLWDAPYS